MTSGRQGRPATVLVADDDPLIVTVVSMALQADGYSVVPAFSCDAALAAHDTTSFDLTILDATMEGYSLNECITAIRRSARGADSPILVLSGVPSRPLDLLDDDGIGFLSKPVELDALRSEVARLIEGVAGGSAA